MPKPSLKQPTKKSAPAKVVPTPPPAPAPAPVAKRVANKGPVLVDKTPNQLAALIGGDTLVGVSRKSLLAAATAADTAAIKAKLGI